MKVLLVIIACAYPVVEICRICYRIGFSSGFAEYAKMLQRESHL